MPHPRIGDSAGGCAFRYTTHRISDFSPLSVEFGLPHHHPWFLEWIGAPESARLKDRGPDAWFRSSICTQSSTCQLHRDVCLMTYSLNILDQYVLCLQGTVTKLREFPSVAVASGAPLPRVHRASVHMEAMGLWRSSLDPVDRAWPSPRDTSSPLNGLRGNRSPGVLTKAQEIVCIAKA